MKIYILLALCLFGCQSKVDEIGLDKELVRVVTEYQEKYPFPKQATKNKTKPIYIYYVYFWKQDKDTIIVLRRSSAGILKSTKGFGVYQSKKLKPTFIIDDEKLGINLISKRMISKSNNKFYWDEKKSFSESFPPTNKYLLKNKSIKLISIDTVWQNWD
jgi:hypothetical protein